MAAVLTAVALAGCGGAGSSLAFAAGLFRFTNQTVDLGDLALFIFPNSSGVVRPLTDQTPTLARLPQGSTSAAIDLAPGTYQVTVAEPGTTTPVATRFLVVTEGDGGVTLIEEIDGEVVIADP